MQAAQFRSLTDCCGMCTHETGPTRHLGGILDVVITRCDIPSLLLCRSGWHRHIWSSSTTMVSLHSGRCLSLPATEEILCRPWHLLDIGLLRDALLTLKLNQLEIWPDDIVDFANLYDTETTAILDLLVPPRWVRRHLRPLDARFNAECQKEKCIICRPERFSVATAKRADCVKCCFQLCFCRCYCRQIATLSVIASHMENMWSVAGPATRQDIEASEFGRLFHDKTAGMRDDTADG